MNANNEVGLQTPEVIDPSGLPRSVPQEPVAGSPATGYVHSATVWISPRVLRWTAPAATLVLFGLLFLPWTGAYPGGYRVYTQSAFQTIWGGVSVDVVGAEALDKDQPFDKVHADPLMLFYALLIVVGLMIVAGPIVAPIWATPSEFKALTSCGPSHLGRTRGIAFAIAFGTLVLLMVQLWQGFGLEKAVAAKVDGNLQNELGSATTGAELEKVRIQRAAELGQFNLVHTHWLHLALFVHVLFLAGMGLQFWLKVRGSRPLPRIEAFT